VFGTRGSQVQILPLRPAFSKTEIITGPVMGNENLLGGLGVRCSPKAKVRGSNPLGRASNSARIQLKTAQGNFLSQQLANTRTQIYLRLGPSFRAPRPDPPLQVLGSLIRRIRRTACAERRFFEYVWSALLKRKAIGFGAFKPNCACGFYTFTLLLPCAHARLSLNGSLRRKMPNATASLRSRIRASIKSIGPIGWSSTQSCSRIARALADGIDFCSLS
jgi:hypothetical protein